jgi:hypothetical protein
MVYNPQPPYEILQNKCIDFGTMQKLRRFARYWDLIANSGNFVETTALIWSGVRPSSGAATTEACDVPIPVEPAEIAAREDGRTPFHAFMRLTEWLHQRLGRTDSIALARLMELLFEFLTSELRLDPEQAAARMWRDYQRGGRRDKPGFLKAVLRDDGGVDRANRTRLALPKRQARHFA